jgi:hypothetical protein
MWFVYAPYMFIFCIPCFKAVVKNFKIQICSKLSSFGPPKGRVRWKKLRPKILHHCPFKEVKTTAAPLLPPSFSSLLCISPLTLLHCLFPSVSSLLSLPLSLSGLSLFLFMCSLLCLSLFLFYGSPAISLLYVSSPVPLLSVSSSLSVRYASRRSKTEWNGHASLCTIRPDAVFIEL